MGHIVENEIKFKLLEYINEGAAGNWAWSEVWDYGCFGFGVDNPDQCPPGPPLIGWGETGAIALRPRGTLYFWVRLKSPSPFPFSPLWASGHMDAIFGFGLKFNGSVGFSDFIDEQGKSIDSTDIYFTEVPVDFTMCPIIGTGILRRSHYDQRFLNSKG